MSEPLTRTEEDAVIYLYGGGDETIECQSMRWVITRYKQKCVSILHKGPMTLAAGSRMVLERAKVDGQFGSCYTCESCVEKAKEKTLLRSYDADPQQDTRFGSAGEGNR